ncbi:MAG: PIN domain-containing protein [Acidobacteriota bacterium]
MKRLSRSDPVNSSGKKGKDRLVLDSSWMIAFGCSWHEHHERAFDKLTSLLESHKELWLAAPAIVEAYSVLTRLPVPHRLSPLDAWTLLQRNFQRGARSVALTSKEYWSALEEAHLRKVTGGRVYDFLILRCAEKCHAQFLLTFNTGHFEPLMSGRMSLID